MTIKQATQVYGISKQSIYQRLKREGKSLDYFRDPQTQTITEAGQAWLSTVYSKRATQSNNGQLTESLLVNGISQQLKETQAKLEAQQQANTVLSSKLTEAEKQVKELTEKVSKLEQSNAAKDNTIASLAASVGNLSQQALPGKVDSIWAALFHRRKPKTAPTEGNSEGNKQS